MNETQSDPDAIIDEALNNYDLAPLPTDFVHQVMTCIEAPTPVQIRFQLDFLDWVVPLFGSSFVVLLLFLANRWDVLLNLGWIRVGNLSAAVDSFQPSALFIIGLIVIAEILMAGVVVVWLWADRPGSDLDFSAM